MRPTPLVVFTLVLRSNPIRRQKSSKNVPATRIYVNGIRPLENLKRAPASYRVGS